VLRSNKVAFHVCMADLLVNVAGFDLLVLSFVTTTMKEFISSLPMLLLPYYVLTRALARLQ